MNIFIRAFVPILLLTSGVGGYIALNSMSPKPTVVEYKPQTPPVTVTTAMSQTVSIPVYSRGIVSPGSELQIVTEIAGRVVKVSSNFASGGFFKKGELLLEVDATRYKLEITKAKARLLTVQQAYDRLIANQGLDEDEVNGIRRSKKFKKAQQREALANVAAAKADVKIANNQIAKAKVLAPFDGRVREAFVGRGQYVTPGMQIARVYAVDKAEVRLPLSDHQLSLVNAPVRYQDQEVANEGPPVTLQLEYAGHNYLWSGKIVRTEGGVDIRNRLMYVVAQIEGPYERDSEQPGRPPLSAGQFVEAQVKGKTYSGVVVLPRKVLRNGSNVWIVDADERLQKRNVDILHKGRELIYLADGLEPGDQVVLTRLDVAIEGMKVRSTHEDNLDIVDANSNVVAEERTFGDNDTTEIDDLWEVQQVKSRRGKEGLIKEKRLIQQGAQKISNAQSQNKSSEIKIIEHKKEEIVANVDSTEIAAVVAAAKLGLSKPAKREKLEEDVASILDRIAAKAEEENKSIKFASNAKRYSDENKVEVVKSSIVAPVNINSSDNVTSSGNKEVPSQQVAANSSKPDNPRVNSQGAAEAVVPRLLRESAQ